MTNQKLASNAVTPAKIRGRAVTAGKLAAGAVGTAALGDGAVTAAKLAPGTVITGRGAVASFHRQMADGQTLTVATIPGFGTLSATCASGNATSTFTNESASIVTARRASFSTGAHAVVSSPVGAGAPVTVASSASDQQVLWQLGFTDVQGTDHVATANVSNVPDGTGCIVMGQVQSTG